jgi:secondary thiamine-phosphate synthase enzyme
MVVTRHIQLRTQGDCDIQDITGAVVGHIRATEMKTGTVTIFCPGSTGGLTTIEYGDGVITDLSHILDDIVPPDQQYQHRLRWGDNNGHSHIRAVLIGPSLTVPFVDRQLTLDALQQIVFCDFDTRPRSRRLVVQIIGE